MHGAVRLAFILCLVASPAFAGWSGSWGTGSGGASLSSDETITGDWDNTANPWADDEVADDITAGTAAALAADPTDCSSNQFANAIAASGALTCSAIADADVPDTITINLAGTATALAADPADCSSNQFANAIAASGALTCAGIADADVPNDITINLATLATTLTITDNESTAENNALIFTAGGALTGGNLGLESDGDAYYTPSTGVITATGFAGALTGNASTATALAADPTDCGANEFATTIAASGNLTCAALSDTSVPNDITIASSAAGSFGGNLTLTADQPALLLNEDTAGDTDWWIRADSDNAGDNDDALQIGTGATPGTGLVFEIDTGGVVADKAVMWADTDGLGALWALADSDNGVRGGLALNPASNDFGGNAQNVVTLYTASAYDDDIAFAPGADQRVLVTNKVWSLTDNVQADILTMAVATADSACFIMIPYSYVATDGADTQHHAGTVSMACYNDDGAVTCLNAEDEQFTHGSSGVVNDTWATNVVGTNATLRVTMDSTVINANGTLTFGVINNPNGCALTKN